MIVFDTNLLVYAHRERTAEHRAARRALEQGSRQAWGLALPTIAEFLAVVTHPAAARPSTQAEAAAFLTNFLADARGAVLHPGLDFARRLLDTADELNVSGQHAFDLQIALVARDHGADQIWSHDRGFVGLPGIIVHDPLAEDGVKRDG